MDMAFIESVTTKQIKRRTPWVSCAAYAGLLRLNMGEHRCDSEVLSPQPENHHNWVSLMCRHQLRMCGESLFLMSFLEAEVLPSEHLDFRCRCRHKQTARVCRSASAMQRHHTTCKHAGDAKAEFIHQQTLWVFTD